MTALILALDDDAAKDRLLVWKTLELSHQLLEAAHCLLIELETSEPHRISDQRQRLREMEAHHQRLEWEYRRLRYWDS